MLDRISLARRIDRLDRRRLAKQELPRQSRKRIAQQGGYIAQPIQIARPRIDPGPRLDLSQHRRRPRSLDCGPFDCR
jgi:hypothetical protein